MTLGHRTNAIFLEAVQMAIDLEIDALKGGGALLLDRRIAQTFGGVAVVVRELQRLREMNAASGHFELGAYHNALLYAVLPGQLETLNDAHRDEPMEFCGGRYRIRVIDVESLFDTFFEDTDFMLPKDVVNAFAAGEKFVLGIDAGVFGVANELRPHDEELEPLSASKSAVEPIAELPEAQEVALRRRHRSAPAAVLGEIEAMGVLYRAGETFPYWPAWLDPRG